jgi:hypothetical protein
MLDHRLKKHEPEERLPPDLDEHYEILSEYRAGDERRPIIPLLLKFLRERALLKYILFLSFILNIVFSIILLLNVIAAISLASAQSSVTGMIANNTSGFVKTKVISSVGGVKVVELTFSTGIGALDSLIWVRKAYAAVGAG